MRNLRFSNLYTVQVGIFWVVTPCGIAIDSLKMEAARSSETFVCYYNYM